MTPLDAYTMSPDVSAAHKGGFALAQRFPQPLLDCDSSVKRKELLPNLISPEPESQSKGQSNELVRA
jgi:hypothetical protein